MRSTPWRALLGWLGILAGLLAMAALLAWLMGAFHARVAPGPAQAPVGEPVRGAVHVVATKSWNRTEDALGTVRAVHETLVASRILGRVRTLAITRAGQPVQQDEVLAELEADDLDALLAQARAAHKVATTLAEKAQLDLERTTALAGQGAASGDKLATDRAALAAATAEAERAAQNVAAAETALSFATIRAPRTGIVVDKRVQVGDTVMPGQPICVIYDPTRLQLVAVVREELAGRLQVGQAVVVTLDALGKRCDGVVAEIVPATSTQSRAFEVKVTGPCQPGIVTGMFGRLAVPLDAVAETVVPRAAVRSVGQLDFVRVVVDGRSVRRHVRLGAARGDDVVVLAGLAPGEAVELAGTAR